MSRGRRRSIAENDAAMAGFFGPLGPGELERIINARSSHEDLVDQEPVKRLYKPKARADVVRRLACVKVNKPVVKRRPFKRRRVSKSVLEWRRRRRLHMRNIHSFYRRVPMFLFPK